MYKLEFFLDFYPCFCMYTSIERGKKRKFKVLCLFTLPFGTHIPITTNSKIKIILHHFFLFIIFFIRFEQFKFFLKPIVAVRGIITRATSKNQPRRVPPLTPTWALVKAVKNQPRRVPFCCMCVAMFNWFYRV